MRSMQLQAFLSCSFDPADQDVVDFFSSVCRGVDVLCVNVDRGHISTPPERARELIQDSHVLIAVATRRQQITAGVYAMPKAVDEEMSMAYATRKPILLFAENGVDTSTGFARNYSTYLEFDRSTLFTPTFLQKALSSIHTMKVDVISPQDLQLSQQGQEHVFIEASKWLVELIEIPPNFTWRYSQTRRLVFTSRFNDPIKAMAWASVPAVGTAAPDIFKWGLTMSDGTKPFVLKPTETEHTHECLEVSIDVDPKPEAGDVVEYNIWFESPYLNPIFAEDIKDPRPAVIVGGREYTCCDGFIPIIRTKDMKFQFRVPSTLGLLQNDIVAFVGSHTNKIDYLVESEMKRISTTTISFGGNIVIDINVESPLLQHMYGVAWNPPKRP